MKEVTTREVLDFYDEFLRKTVKNKEKVVRLEMHKSEYINYIRDVLNGKIILSHRYNIFLIYEPKPRLIMSLNITDKVINHFFTHKRLMPTIEPLLDNRNVAARVNKGTSYAIKLIKKYIEYYKKKNITPYVLKIDISKYFYSIDHTVLLNMLKNDLDRDDFLFVKKIIESTNFDYINEQINKILKKYKNIDLPYYEYGKGLPIGNLSSQCLSIYYLNRLDHFIVHDLKLKNYVRYMDDFLLFSEDKEYLERCKDIILSKLINEYKLKINYKKTFIIKMNAGLTFLGYKFMIYNNKTIMTVRRESINNIKRRIKRTNYLFLTERVSFERYFCSISNYYYSYICNRVKIMNIVNNNILLFK